MVDVVVGVVPFCAAVGFVTPLLVDRVSAGDARRAGAAYAANVVGCILGPLVCGFAVLPVLGERWSLLAFSVPLWVVAARVVRSSPVGGLHPTNSLPTRGVITMLPALIPIHTVSSSEGSKSVKPHSRIQWHR